MTVAVCKHAKSNPEGIADANNSRVAVTGEIDTAADTSQDARDHPQFLRVQFVHSWATTPPAQRAQTACWRHEDLRGVDDANPDANHRGRLPRLNNPAPFRTR